MKKNMQVVYGIGGHDPSKPNNNILEVVELPDEPETIDPVKEAAMEKLRELGLTDEEISAIIGTGN
jgi:hypothetical protein